MSIQNTLVAFYLMTAWKALFGTTLSLTFASAVLCGFEQTIIHGISKALGKSREKPEEQDLEKGESDKEPPINPFLLFICYIIVGITKALLIATTSYVVFYLFFPEHF